jgi:ABC-2 type transport system ATP-binding protein
LIKLAVGMLTPQAGVLRGWRDLTLGYLPEERGLYAQLTVEEHLRHFASIGGAASPRRATAAWIDRLGLGRYRRSRARSLSKGNAQRLQLALALVSDPELLVLDEPFTGLDIDARSALGRLLGELAPDRYLMLSSHSVDLVDRLCEDAVILADGEIAVSGPVATLRQQSGSPILRLAGRPAAGSARTVPEALLALNRACANGFSGEFTYTLPSLEELYVATVGQGGERSAQSRL